MKLTLDTQEKKVFLKNSVNLKELVETMKTLLKEDWKNYKVVAENEIQSIPYNPTPEIQPLFPPFEITCKNDNDSDRICDIINNRFTSASIFFE